MKINDRLKEIGDFVPLSSCPLDIGCDHALLSIYLIKEKKIPFCYASDNKEGPLMIAKKNIKLYHVEKNIKIILADGLDAYQEGVNTITISGMGGLTINKIIEERKDLLGNIDYFILSPNNFTNVVRLKMMRLGYKIIEEKVVKEKNIIYPILVFQKGKVKYKEDDLYLGPILKKKKDSLTKEHYERELLGRKNLLKMLPKSYFHKRKQTKKEMKWLKKVLEK